ncbi:MAG TPA: hypothetical protein VM243_15585 [Phycisphaerae bacterium]|nr:hypothetical protein [Phycisphaerae bacterium]
MITDYPDTLAVVEYHVSDAPYSYPWGESRANFYNIWSAGLPWFDYDGLGDAWPIGSYESNFLTRQAVPTKVTMSVGAEHVSGNTYSVTSQTCLEESGDPLLLRIYSVMVEDWWPGTDQGEDKYHRNTFRAAATTEDAFLFPGECQVVTKTITPTYVTESNLKVIAWAQEALSAGPAEVHQASKDLYPFETLPAMGDYDNDGDVDLDDHTGFAGCMSGPDPGTPPSSTCLYFFDGDDDSDVDTEDFSSFQQEFTGPR